MTSEVKLTRLEYWSDTAQDWVVGHAGVALLHPERYPERLAANGKIGRAIEVDTGIVHQITYTTCEFCGDQHPSATSGGCLL